LVNVEKTKTYPNTIEINGTCRRCSDTKLKKKEIEMFYKFELLNCMIGLTKLFFIQSGLVK